MWGWGVGGGEGGVCWGRGGGGEERGTEGWLGRSDLEGERERKGKGDSKTLFYKVGSVKTVLASPC